MNKHSVKNIKCLSLFLAFALMLVPLMSISASAYSVPTKDAWYLIGDVEYDGVVDALDARKALRISAYLEENPAAGVRFDAGDVDADGSITVNDARRIARIAAGIDAAPSQIADPDNVAISNAEALELVRTVANQLKTDGSYNFMRPFHLQTITKGLDAYTDDTRGLGKNDDFKEMFDELKNTNEVSENKEYNYSSKLQYNYGFKSYMEVIHEDFVIGAALKASDIAKNTNKKTGLTRTIRIYVADQTWTAGSEPSYIRMDSVMKIDGITEMYDQMAKEFAGMEDYISLDAPVLSYKNGWVEIKYTEIPGNETTPTEYQIVSMKYSADVHMSFTMHLNSLIVRTALGTTKKAVTLNISNRIQRNYNFDILDGASKFYVPAPVETTVPETTVPEVTD